MESDLITKILSTNPLTKQIFAGWFPSDQIPSPHKLKYPTALVVNLDPHQMEGSHWVGIFAEGQKRPIYYFDSLCMPTSPIIEENFLSKFPQIIKNQRPFQSPKASTCAHHCIVFIYYMSLGYTFPQYIELLSKKENPDSFVKFIVNKMIE